jgi:hypothetical protein
MNDRFVIGYSIYGSIIAYVKADNQVGCTFLVKNVFERLQDLRQGLRAHLGRSTGGSRKGRQSYLFIPVTHWSISLLYIMDTVSFYAITLENFQGRF